MCIFGGLAGAADSNRLRADSELVLVRASVLDREDKFLPNLHKKDFRIFDSGTEQDIASFSLADEPVSVTILLDASSSMKGALRFAKDSISRFLADCNPEDEFSLALVRNSAEILVANSRDKNQILRSVYAEPAQGWTALIDGVYLALQDLVRHGRYERKLLLIVSDGRDNSSRYTERDLLDLLRESGVTVCSLGVNVWPGEEYLLRDLAANSGGRYIRIKHDSDLPATMGKLDLRYQYVLGFRPSGVPRDGKYHHLGLRLTDNSRARAYWRPGYYSQVAEK